MSKRTFSKSEVNATKNRMEAMRQRCCNKNHSAYIHYGGRGIKICDEWLGRDGYNRFAHWALTHGFHPDLEIDRIDNDGNYSPENCRFVTHKENMRNTRSNVRYAAFGEEKLMSEWIEDPRCVVSIDTLESRISYGWCLEEAITLEPLDTGIRRINKTCYAFGETMRTAELARDERCLVPKKVLYKRIASWNCSDEICATTPLKMSEPGRKQNRGVTILFEAWSESKPVRDWIKDERCPGLRYETLYQRMHSGKWSNEEAISTPVRK